MTAGGKDTDSASPPAAEGSALPTEAKGSGSVSAAPDVAAATPAADDTTPGDAPPECDQAGPNPVTESVDSAAASEAPDDPVPVSKSTDSTAASEADGDLASAATEAAAATDVPTEAEGTEPRPAEESVAPAPLAVVVRTLVLAALIGAALVSTVQLFAAGDWLARFLRENAADASERDSLLQGALIGAALAVLMAGGGVAWAARRGWPLTRVERLVWFAFPLALLPAVPLFMEHRAWKSKHNHLLPLVLISALVLEVLVARSLDRVPSGLRRGTEWLREHLPRFWCRHGPLMVVLSGAVFYAVFMSFFALRWHFKLQTHIFDLAINNNLLYGGLDGVFMQSPVVFPNDPGRYLAAHAKFGCYLFLPIYALYPRAETLIVLQATLLGFGALPLFGFARKHISPWLAAVLALGYLCYYPMHSANFYEVKWVPVASFFLLSVIWAADAKRWVLCVIAFIWALLMREDLPIPLAVIGGFLLLTGHRPRAGLVMMLVAIAWFVFIRFFVMQQAGSWWFPKMYKDLWAPGDTGFRSVIKTLLTNPPYVLDAVLVKRKVFYLLHLLVPIVFLPARRWYLWAAFIPGFLLTLLATDYKPPTMFSFQYVMYWTPFVFVGAALALRALASTDGGGVKARAAMVAILFSSAVLTYNYGAFSARTGSLKGGYGDINFEFSDAERERYANLRELMKLIPPEAVVAATERVGAHLSSRPVMYSMRHGPHGADYVVVWRKQLNLGSAQSALKSALRSGEYGVLERLGDLALLQRGHDTGGNADLLRDWRL